MVREIFFNGLGSYTDLGLYIELIENIQFPIKQYDLIDIAGGETLSVEGNETDIVIEYSLVSRNKGTEYVNRIRKWLYDIKDFKLIDTSEPNLYYKVKKIECEGVDTMSQQGTRVKISFTCSNYRKYIQEELLTIVAPTSIYNYHDIASKPYIKIYGNGDINLSINNNVTQLRGVADYIELDGELQDCYKDNQLCNNKMVGDFPSLSNGLNNISWSGNISKLEILPRYRV